MSYATTNPPYILAGGGPTGSRLWVYVSTDVHTDVDASGYFTDGHALGMRVSDVMIVVKSSATIGATLHSVQTVTAGGAATISPAILA